MKLSRERYDGVFPKEPSEIEAAALWRRIAESDLRRQPALIRHRMAAIVVAAAVLLLVVGAALLREGGSSPEATSAAEPGLRLSDGSRVLSDPGTDLRVIESARHRVALDLVGGRAVFEVVRLEDREFSVRVGKLLVRVVGTRFTVSLQEGRVRVEVERGRVEIDRPGAPTIELGPGETWTGTDSLPDMPSAADSALPAVPSGADSALLAVPSVAPSGPVSGSAAAPGSSPEATALFERARAARRAGRTAEALEKFERMQREFPNDPRARIAALAAARIRLDELDDPGGALRVLDGRSDAGVGAEDALARRVEGYDRLRDLERCRAARDEYLRIYPNGIHAAVVRGRCSGR